jgi:hypothetical protein
MTGMSRADPLHVSGAGLPALSDVERAVLVEVGSGGGVWPRHKLDGEAVRRLLGLGLLWPRGLSAVALSARGIQVLAEAAKAGLDA